LLCALLLTPLFSWLWLLSQMPQCLRAGARVFASGLVHYSLSAFALPPASRDADRCRLPFHPPLGVESEAPFVEFGVASDFAFFVCVYHSATSSDSVPLCSTTPPMHRCCTSLGLEVNEQNTTPAFPRALGSVEYVTGS
jgi:hypothetical protein